MTQTTDKPRLGVATPCGRLLYRYSSPAQLVLRLPPPAPRTPWRRTQARPVVLAVLDLEAKPLRWHLLLSCGHEVERPARRRQGELQLCRPTAKCPSCANGPGGAP